MRIFFISLFLAFLAISVYLGSDIFKRSAELNEYKYDYAEINRINYGLFNIPLWKEKVFEIIEGKIDDFRFSDDAYGDLETQVETYLYDMYDEWFESGKLIDQLYASLTEGGSKINKMFLNVIKESIEANMEKIDLKGQIPSMAKGISADIQKNEPEIRKRIQQELVNMLLADNAMSVRDRRIPIYRKHQQNDLASTNTYLKAGIENQGVEMKSNIRWIYLTLIGALVLVFIARRFVPFREFIFGLTIISIVMLVLGVTLPMMDIDARLNAFSMELFDEQITFDEQIMYFQSKSILDVTETLIKGQGIDLKIVGVLIFLFSIVFPFFKLVLSTSFMYIKKLQHNKWVQMIIFNLGKWSMADVFVVAMFMAYIGFYGLITSQLTEISSNQTGYAVETLNYSKLSPGALFFTSYCLLSILASLILNKKANEVDDINLV